MAGSNRHRVVLTGAAGRIGIETEEISYLVVNGMLANRYRFADLQDTIDVLGYRPLDDAWAGA